MVDFKFIQLINKNLHNKYIYIYKLVDHFQLLRKKTLIFVI